MSSLGIRYSLAPCGRCVSLSSRRSRRTPTSGTSHRPQDACLSLNTPGSCSPSIACRAFWKHVLPVFCGYAQNIRGGFDHLSGRSSFRFSGKIAEYRFNEFIVCRYAHPCQPPPRNLHRLQDAPLPLFRTRREHLPRPHPFTLNASSDMNMTLYGRTPRNVAHHYSGV